MSRYCRLWSRWSEAGVALCVLLDAAGQQLHEVGHILIRIGQRAFIRHREVQETSDPLLATLSAAAMTDLAAARTPAIIWEQMSLPHLYAEDAMLLRELNLLRISCTDEATVAFILFMAEATVLLTASHVVVLLL